jgi:hypothetical protein
VSSGHEDAAVRAKAIGDGVCVFEQFLVGFIAKEAIQPSQQDEAVFQFGKC